MIDDCVGAKFEILVDGETKACRDTVLTAMGLQLFSRVRTLVAR
jgi:hypothetical protein